MATAATPSQQVVVDITKSFGSCLIGSWLSCIIYGASTLQVYIYFINFGDHDPLQLQLLIFVMWILDTGNQVLELKGNWRPLAAEYGNVVGLAGIEPEHMHHTWIEALIIFIVQFYFIRRIWLFAKQSLLRSRTQKVLGKIFVVFMVLLASWQMIGVVIYQRYGYGTDLATLSSPLLVGLNISLRAAAAALDIITALGMLYLLTRSGGGGHFNNTRRMVYRLILVTVGSGALTAIAVTIVLILLAVYPDTIYYTIVEFALCSLYFSTLLVNLNTREFVQGKPTGVVSSMSAFDPSPRRYATDGSDGNTLTLTPMDKKSTGGESSMLDIRIDREIDAKLDGPDVFAPRSFRQSKYSSTV